MATAKVIKNSSSFSATLNYVAKEQAEEICSNNLYSDDTAGRAHEMHAIAAQARTGAPVLHHVISLPPGQTATNEQWQKAAQAYLKEMGFDTDKTQYVVTRHDDRDHQHIHIVANRIQLDQTRALSDSNSKRRSHTACRAAERAAGLEVYSGKTIEQGKIAEIRKAIDDSLANKPTPELFKKMLAERGIEARFNIQSTGRIAGISFKDESRRPYKGRELGKDYSIGDLVKRGLQTPQQQQKQLYEAKKDARAITQGIEDSGSGNKLLGEAMRRNRENQDDFSI